MLDTAAFKDLRSYIKRRVAFGRYRVGTEYFKADLIDVEILTNGTVRARLSIIPTGTVQINRVELWSSNNELWAHQDCDITVSTGQTGVLYWFDFTVEEVSTNG